MMNRLKSQLQFQQVLKHAKAQGRRALLASEKRRTDKSFCRMCYKYAEWKS